MTECEDGRQAALRVLLLDEHGLRRAALQRLLTALGEAEGIKLEVLPAGTPGEGASYGAQVALIGSAEPESMVTLLADVREALPDTPIAVLSEQETAAEAVQALEGGARCVISTRIEPALMLHALRLLAAGGHYIPLRALGDWAEESVPQHVPASAIDASSGLLTYRRKEVLRLLQEGQSNERIACNLDVDGLRPAFDKPSTAVRPAC